VRLLILFLLSARLMAAEVLVDRIVAVVNEELVTKSDLDKYKDIFKIHRGSMSEDEFEAATKSEEKLLNKLIDEKIISQYVAEKDIRITDEELTQSINQIIRQYAMTLPQLKAQLEREGIDYDVFKREKTKELEVAKVLEYEVKRTANITEDDVKTYFKKKTGEDVLLAEYKIQAVLSSKEAPVKKAADEFKAGADFNDLAGKYCEDEDMRNNGGDLGFLNPSTLIQGLKETVLGMSIGEVKGPVKVKTKTGFDYYLVKLAEVRNSENPHYTSGKEMLRRELMGSEINRQLSLWLERKRSESYVNINLA
jgi:peptidyl-prolyl cis-trans isomerase SurA